MSNKKYKPVLSERDRSIFRDLIESRVMTLTQISDLHFGGSYEYAKKRFQQLKAADYVHERKPTHNRGRYYASTLSLARSGFMAMAEDPFVLGEEMSWDDLRERLDFAESSLSHELEVIDMKVAFSNAIRTVASLALEEFSTYPRRYQFETEHFERGKIFTLKPDGYARVSGIAPREHSFFFEWDRSSEAHRKLGIKAFGYQRYFESGAFAMWNGVGEEQRDDYPFTPIFILPNEERRNNTAEHLLQLRHPKTGARIRRNALLLTTHAEFLSDPLSAIYVTLSQYQAVTRDTPYDAATHKAMSRALERDRFVSDRIEKTVLFGGV